MEAARRALEVAQRVLEGLERVAAAGVRKVQRVMGLARGLGAQAAAEREARAQVVLRAEVERQQRAAAELRQREEAERARPVITQAQREAARARTASTWGGVEEAGRHAREASESSQRQQATERERQR